MEHQTGMAATMLRVPSICPLNTVIDAIIKIDNFNKKHLPDVNHLKINPKLWTNNTAPTIGKSRISSENAHRYGPKDLLNVLKREDDPIRIG